MNDYAQTRKQYVDEVRRSFYAKDTPQDEPELEKGVQVSFFKLRLFLAAVLFAAFLLCDCTHSSFYTFSTDALVSMLEKQQFEPQMETVLQAWNTLRGQGLETN